MKHKDRKCAISPRNELKLKAGCKKEVALIVKRIGTLKEKCGTSY